MPPNVNINQTSLATLDAGVSTSESDEQGISAFDAINAMKKQKGVRYGSITGNTPDKNIDAKISQLQKYFPEVNVPKSVVKTTLQNLAKTSPEEWATVQHLAKDIDDYVTLQGATGGPDGAQMGTSEYAKLYKSGVAKLCRTILGFSKTFLGQNVGYGSSMFDIGYSPLEVTATKNYKYTMNKLFPKISTFTPENIIDALHKVKDNYDYELSVYNSLVSNPHRDSASNSISASDTRLTKYEEVWNALCKKIKSDFYIDRSKLYTFLTAYSANPVTPLSTEEQKSLNSYISRLQVINQEQAFNQQVY